MIEISIDYQGLWAGLSQKPYRDAAVVRVARRLLKTIVSDFARRTGRESLDFRFSDSAKGALSLSTRSAKYEKRQIKVLGRPRPFFSPKRKLAHMQNVIRVPGIGHNVTNRNLGVGSVAVRLTLPGARALNATRKGNKNYAAEFLNLTRPGQYGYDAVSQQWIRQSFAKLFPQALADALRRAPRKRLKAVA